MKGSLRRALKEVLGQVPLTAETYWWLRQRGAAVGKMRLPQVAAHLPQWAAQAQAAAAATAQGRRVFLVAALRLWIAHTTLVALGLAGLGHRVTLGYLPYPDWWTRVSRFDLRRMNAYLARMLRPGAAAFTPLPLWPRPHAPALPPPLAQAVEEVTRFDVQYTQQVETPDPHSPLYRLRHSRNTATARALLALWQRQRPDVVIVPNGSILAFGAAYHTARYLDIPVVTYEFGEQRDRVWIAQNAQVMLQDTTALWQAVQQRPLSPSQWEQVKELFAARRGGRLWANFSRRWQDAPSQSGEQARQALGLDGRPLFLMATNVQGDSLVLGREVFTRSMAEWVRETVRYFARRPEVQLVIRIHPGEQRVKGPSLAEEVRRALPRLPEHIHLVPADAKVNTYDLIETAAAGLVFTTTVGLEMAMSGLPVVVAGKTHYRGRGFTFDPTTWDDYWQTLDALTRAPQRFRLSEQQIALAWKYAYHFFFDYPLPFPWHLHFMEEDVRRHPWPEVWNPTSPWAKTLACFVGAPLPWESPSREDVS